MDEVQTTDSGRPGWRVRTASSSRTDCMRSTANEACVVVVAAALAVGRGVRDQHVEAAEGRDGPLGERLDLRGVADVGGQRNEPIAGGELGAERVEALLAARRDRDASALGEEDAHDLAADAVAAARRRARVRP